MKNSKNIPYTRSSGIEISKNKPYLNFGDNRQKRRERPAPFMGNGKNYSLTVIGQYAYVRAIQFINGKKIFHYLPK